MLAVDMVRHGCASRPAVERLYSVALGVHERGYTLIRLTLARMLASAPVRWYITKAASAERSETERDLIARGIERAIG